MVLLWCVCDSIFERRHTVMVKNHNDPDWYQKKKKRDYDRLRAADRAANEKAARHAAKPHLAALQKIREEAQHTEAPRRRMAKKPAVSHHRDSDWYQKAKKAGHEQPRNVERAAIRKAARHAAKPHLAMMEKMREAAQQREVLPRKREAKKQVPKKPSLSGDDNAATQLLAMMRNGR